MSKSFKYQTKIIGGRVYCHYSFAKGTFSFLFTTEEEAQKAIRNFLENYRLEAYKAGYPNNWEEKIREDDVPEDFIEQNLTVQPNNSIKAKKI